MNSILSSLTNDLATCGCRKTAALLRDMCVAAERISERSPRRDEYITDYAITLRNGKTTTLRVSTYVSRGEDCDVDMDPEWTGPRPDSLATEEDGQIAEAVSEIRAALAADPAARERCLARAEACRQSMLGMQIAGSFDVLGALRDQNTYIAIQIALDHKLPDWATVIAQITPDMSDDAVLSAVLAAGYIEPKSSLSTQLWEECPRCGAEPIYLESGLCERCSR